MRKLGLFILAGAISALGAQAQTTASAETSAAASAHAGQTGAAAQSSTSASASRGTERPANASATSGNSASANAGSSGVQLDNGTTVDAVLSKPLDAKKCKPGDKIEARTTSDVKENGRVVLRKGSRLHGHVTEAEARSKASAESSLGMEFDSVTLRNGEQVPLHLGVQALAAASSETAASMGSMGDEDAMVGGGASGMASEGVRGGGGLLGGAGGAVGGAAGVAGGATGNAGRMAGGTLGETTRATGGATENAGGLDAAGHLTSTSSGVFGLRGLNLTSAAGSATEGSVVTSNTRNVHLDSGTQMVLSAAKR